MAPGSGPPDSGPPSGGALRTLLLDHAGLGQPRRLERTLAVIVAAVLALVVAPVWLYFLLDETLRAGTPRWWYLVYVATLIFAGLLVAPWPRIAAVVLSLAVLEVGFGIGTAVLYRFDLSRSSLFPRDNIVYTSFTWHPLLQAVPMLPKAGPREGQRFVHNSQRQRGPERSAADLQGKRVIALFGGSTTYDVTLAEDESWARRLEALLGSAHYAVVNHGLPGFTTVENLLQTAFYADTDGVAPTCSVYYIGWNDLRNSHVPRLDPAYADRHLPNQVDAQLARRLSDPYLAVSPTLSLLVRLIILGVDTVRPATWPPATPRSDADPALEAIYERNIRAISAINRGRGIRTIWVGQLMDRERLEAGEPWGWVPYLTVQAQWPLVQRLNDIARREAAGLGDLYVEVPVDLFGTDDFADHGHFQPTGADKFARYLAPIIAGDCR